MPPKKAAKGSKKTETTSTIKSTVSKTEFDDLVDDNEELINESSKRKHEAIVLDSDSDLSTDEIPTFIDTDNDDSSEEEKKSSKSKKSKTKKLKKEKTVSKKQTVDVESESDSEKPSSSKGRKKTAKKSTGCKHISLNLNFSYFNPFHLYVLSKKLVKPSENPNLKPTKIVEPNPKHQAAEGMYNIIH